MSMIVRSRERANANRDKFARPPQQAALIYQLHSAQELPQFTTVHGPRSGVHVVLCAELLSRATAVCSAGRVHGALASRCSRRCIFID